ncbi:putative calcium-binding protein CML41 [Acorus calamus]|uniref:Calcium-binding protein CML41 n=1 Tax=Acorus calamus TaxID=4465 RepID=A0AAV9EJH1_ACOCL|nr:putative calcium-binding protein CML41 [Acorus calamus]
METTTNVSKLRQVFDYLDKNRDGKISVDELVALYKAMGEEGDSAEEEAKAAMKCIDSDCDGLLDYESFVSLMMEGDDADLRAAFEAFELVKGSGCITPDGLRRALQRLGDVKTHEECAAMIRAFDVDGNGVLDFHEFRRMMSS